MNIAAALSLAAALVLSMQAANGQAAIRCEAPELWRNDAGTLSRVQSVGTVVQYSPIIVDPVGGLVVLGNIDSQRWAFQERPLTRAFSIFHGQPAQPANGAEFIAIRWSRGDGELTMTFDGGATVLIARCGR